jgi:hypothetical protein
MELKRSTVSLASLSRTIARQRSRMRFLTDGDATTRFFRIQASHRNRKNYVPTFQHEGCTFSTDEAKFESIFSYYNEILGESVHSATSRRPEATSIADATSLQLQDQDACFSADEIRMIVNDLPGDRAPGLAGYNDRPVLQGGLEGDQTGHNQCL